MTDHPLVIAARKYKGTPWHHLGRNTKERRGLDCGGLIIVTAADLGRVLNDLKSYKRTPHAGSLRKYCEEQLGSPLPRSEWASGCVVICRTEVVEHHLAILCNHPTGYLGLGIIHASGDAKQVTEHAVDERFYRSRMISAYRSPA